MPIVPPKSRRQHISRYAGIGVLAALSVLLSGLGHAVHPQDGPHADVEIEILDRAVVFDIFMNLVMVDEMVELARENPSDIHPVEEQQVLDSLTAYITEQHRVAIDGVEVGPVLRSFEVVRGDPSNVVLFPRSGMRGLNKVHLVFEYPLKGEARSVAMRWGTFPDDLTADPDADGNRPPIRLEARLRAEGRLEIVVFTADEPEFTFHATGQTAESRFAAVPELAELAPSTTWIRVPILLVLTIFGQLSVLLWIAKSGATRAKKALLLLSVPVMLVTLIFDDVARVPVWTSVSPPKTLAADDAIEVFRPLHANIYRAFDYRTESEVYDALARSVTGEMLDTLYNQVYRSLIMIEEGGAVSSVQDVRLNETTVEAVGGLESGARGFTVQARWQVDGVVNHFGHSHWRTNEYLARFGVVETQDGWRIASHEPLEQHRLDTDPFTDPAATNPAPAAPQEL